MTLRCFRNTQVHLYYTCSICVDSALSNYLIAPPHNYFKSGQYIKHLNVLPVCDMFINTEWDF